MMIEQLFDTGSLKSKRQMTPNSPSALGLTVGNLPSSTVKSPMNGATSPSKSRVVALSAEKGSRTQLLALPQHWWPSSTQRAGRHGVPSHLAPGMRDRAPEQPQLLKEQARSVSVVAPSTSQGARKFTHTVFPT